MGSVYLWKILHPSLRADPTILTLVILNLNISCKLRQNTRHLLTYSRDEGRVQIGHGDILMQGLTIPGRGDKRNILGSEC